MELKNHMLKGNLPTLLLALLKEQPRYGFEIANEIHERTGNYLAIKEGTMYPALRRMDREGLVRSWWQKNKDGPQRRYYKLTPKGEKHLRERVAEWKAFCGSVESVLKGPAKKLAGKASSQAHTASAYRLVAPKEYDKAEKILAEAARKYPKNAGFRYDLARAQALSGKRKEALESLAAALKLDLSLRKLAKTDEDLDSLRAEAAFKKLVGS